MENTVNTTNAPTEAPSEAAPQGDNGAMVDGKAVSNMTQAEAKEAIRKYKVKINGAESEVDEKELIRGYSHQQAANKAMQEGLKSKKQAEEFISMLKDEGRLFEVLEKIGHNPRSLAEKYLAAQIEEELMDPREKELKYTKAENEAFKKKEADAIKRAEDEKIKEISSKYAKEYTESFTTALEGEKLPAKKETIQEMAKYIKRATEIGFKMTAQEAAKLVKEDIITRQKSLVGDLDGDALINYFGEDVANKIRKWDTSRVKTPEQNLKTPEPSYERKPSDRNKPTKRMTPDEWRNFNRGKR
jgi:hypothetical protein